MIHKPKRPKKCPECRVRFTPRRPIQPTCGRFACEFASATKRAQKREQRRQEYAADLERRAKAGLLDPMPELLKKAQTSFNRYIRVRDAELGCVSCDKPPTWRGQWHASHYRPVGSHPEFRFDEKNCHKACSVCNNFLSGALVEYRQELLRRIGEAEVARLESHAPRPKWTREQLVEIKKSYSKRARELLRARVRPTSGVS